MQVGTYTKKIRKFVWEEKGKGRLLGRSPKGVVMAASDAIMAHITTLIIIVIMVVIMILVW